VELRSRTARLASDRSLDEIAALWDPEDAAWEATPRFLERQAPGAGFTVRLEHGGDVGAALAEIERATQATLPAPLAASFIAAGAVPRDQQGLLRAYVSYVFGRLIADLDRGLFSPYRGASPTTRDFRRLIEEGGATGEHWTALDYGRFFWYCARAFWQPALLRSGLKGLEGAPDEVRLAGSLRVVQAMSIYGAATAQPVPILGELSLRPVPWAAGSPPYFPSPEAAAEALNRRHAWWYLAAVQVFWATFGQMPAEAVRYLFPAGVLELEPSDALAAAEDAELAERAAALSGALWREAEEEAVYTPAEQGMRVALPARHLLTDLGVVSLRVWASPEGLWVLPADEQGKGRLPAMPALRGGDALPLLPQSPSLKAMAAGLWHDLRVAGEEALPARGRTSTRSKPAGERRRAARVLPARRYLRFEERQRQWGSGEERERITRRAHQVRGFLRRLPQGQKAGSLAREFARAAGLVLPDGNTYVRPHTRGGTEPGEPVVRARGLMSLELLLD